MTPQQRLQLPDSTVQGPEALEHESAQHSAAARQVPSRVGTRASPESGRASGFRRTGSAQAFEDALPGLGEEPPLK